MELLQSELLTETTPDGVLIITINRPDRLNALSMSVKHSIATCLTEVNSRTDVTAVVLTGAGERSFAAGQDLAEAKDFRPDTISDWIDTFHELYSAVLDSEKPVIAAVNGYAVGAAFQLALLCDLRVAASHARFGMPEIDDGIPCITGTWTLYEAIGRTRTADLIFTGRMIDADEAKSWGLVNLVVGKDELLERSLVLARTLASKPAKAIALNKARLRDLLLRERDTAEAFALRAHAEAYATGVPQQRMADFLARRREGRSA